jgi:NitT/TauT family transport system ATP-binding protein
LSPTAPRPPATPDIATDLGIDAKGLLPLVDAAALLDFLRVSDADLEITSTGKDFTIGDIQSSKRIFAQQVGTRAPLVRTICNALRDCPDGSMDAGFFLDILQQGFSNQDAQQQLDTAIDWGRYAEIFDYNAYNGKITADPDAALLPTHS